MSATHGEPMTRHLELLEADGPYTPELFAACFRQALASLRLEPEVYERLIWPTVRPWSTMRPGRAFAGMQARLWPAPATAEPCRHGERPGACLACAIGDKCRSHNDGPHNTSGPDIGHCVHCFKRVRRLRLNAGVTYVESA